MADAVFLRDRAMMTRLLVLADLEQNPGTSLSSVGRRLGITVQAVSDHVRALAADGSVHGSPPRVTPVGRQALREGADRIRRAARELVPPGQVIDATSARATQAVRAGEIVGLVMRDGDLCTAPASGASSTGQAVGDAAPGEEVIVSDLEGILDLRPGHLRVLSLPGPVEGGTQGIAGSDVREASQGRRVGVVGTGASILADRLGVAVEFAFAAAHAAFNAAERGLDVVLWVTRDRLGETMQTLEALDRGTLHPVPLEVRHVGGSG